MNSHRNPSLPFAGGIGKTAVIYPAAFLVAVSVGMLLLGMVFYLQEVFHATKGQIGLCAGLWSLGYIVACLGLRPFTDRARPRYLLMVSTFCMCVFTLGAVMSRSLLPAVASYCMVGVTASLFWPPLMGWLSADLGGEELNRVMARFNLSWSVGAIVSNGLAGWLSAVGAAVPLYVVAGILLLTCSMIVGAALALPRVREDEHNAETAAGAKEREDRSTPLRFTAWIGVFAVFMAMGLIGNVFPAAAREDLGLAKFVIGLLLLARALFSTLTFGAMGRTAFWHNRAWQMVLCVLLMAIALAAMPFCRAPSALAPLLAGMGVLIAAGYTNSLFHGLEGSAHRAARSAIHEALLSGGLITGAAAGGALAQAYSTAAAYRVFAVVMLAAAVVQAVISWRPGLVPRGAESPAKSS